jgi:tRNA(adenine34) deaminase
MRVNNPDIPVATLHAATPARGHQLGRVRIIRYGEERPCPQYWRDWDSLERWARSEPHRIWWQQFLKDTGGTGFWHETYFMRGGMEAIYDDMPKPVGMLNFAPVKPARGPMFSARTRASRPRRPPSPRPICTAPRPSVTTDGALMDAALVEARRARDAGEVPIGAVVALDGVVVGRGFNQPISSADPTAHAEILAIREAARASGNYRLAGAVLYVTIEPCLMCVGALVHARIARLVFGANEPRTGAVVSTLRGVDLPGHNHRVAVVAGVREQECRELMQEFFRARR